MLNAALLVVALAPGVADSIFGTGFDDPEGCPDGRQTVADVDYRAQCAHLSDDVTEWSNIWGWSCDTGETVPFPGLPIEATIMNFGKRTYIAAHLHVPADLPNGFGWLVHTEYDYGADLTASLSTRCGDFAPSNPACLSVTVSGQTLVPWRVGGAGFCPLQPGTDYYLNMKFTDPDQVSATCDADALQCAVSIGNNTSYSP
jgi:hypothetical protein